MEEKFKSYCITYAECNGGRLPDYMFTQIRDELKIQEEEAVDILFTSGCFNRVNGYFLLRQNKDI
jgi:hypothetical protein